MEANRPELRCCIKLAQTPQNHWWEFRITTGLWSVWRGKPTR
jgi:hypothetical protein